MSDSTDRSTCDSVWRKSAEFDDRVPAQSQHFRYTAYGVQKSTDASGNVIRAESAVGFDRGFTGFIIDQEAGLLHARVRQYDPARGRYLSRDPLGYLDSYSMYSGNFIPNLTDPTGLSVEIVFTDGRRVVVNDADDFIKVINAAASGSISSMEFWSHGYVGVYASGKAYYWMGINTNDKSGNIRTGLLINDENGKYGIFNKGQDIQPIFSDRLAKNANIVLHACESGGYAGDPGYSDLSMAAYMGISNRDKNVSVEGVYGVSEGNATPQLWGGKPVKTGGLTVTWNGVNATWGTGKVIYRDEGKRLPKKQ